MILEQDDQIARGAVHHSVLQVPGENEYYIVYHRRPLNETHPNHRETCIYRMEFDNNGRKLAVKMTIKGRPARMLVETPPD